MADNNKIEAGFVDIPNGESTQRIWYKDVEARAAIQQLNPAEVASVAEATAAANELT